MLALGDDRDANLDQKQRAVAERLDQLADILLNIAPSVSLEVEAA